MAPPNTVSREGTIFQLYFDSFPPPLLLLFSHVKTQRLSRNLTCRCNCVKDGECEGRLLNCHFAFLQKPFRAPPRWTMECKRLVSDFRGLRNSGLQDLGHSCRYRWSQTLVNQMSGDSRWRCGPWFQGGRTCRRRGENEIMICSDKSETGACCQEETAAAHE